MRTTPEPARESSRPMLQSQNPGQAIGAPVHGAPPGPTNPESPAQEPTPGRPVLAVVGLSIGTFSFVTIELLPIGLLPLIGTELNRSLSATGQLVTAYALVVLLVSLPLTLVTRWIPKRMLLGGLLALFSIAALASAAAPGFGFLLAARIVTAVA